MASASLDENLNVAENYHRLLTLLQDVKPDAVVLLVLFVAFVGYIAFRELRRGTATFRNLEIVEELTEDDESAAARARWSAFVTALIVFFLAELGDKTQRAALSLSAGSSGGIARRPSPETPGSCR